MRTAIATQRSIPPLASAFTALFAFAITGTAIGDAAAETEFGNCKYYGRSDKADGDPILSDLITEIEDGMEAGVCSGDPNFYRVVTPVYFADSVSFFLLSDMRPDGSSDASGGVARPNLHEVVTAVFMAMNPAKREMMRSDEGFVETQFVALGTFREIITIWSKIFAARNKSSLITNLSDLDAEDRGVLSELFKDIKKPNSRRITAVLFEEGRPSETPPGYSLFVRGDEKSWSIEFDFSEPSKVTIRSVGELIEG